MSMQKLTFKEYLESKEQLREALLQTPVVMKEYEVYKYCSIALGETDEEKKIVGLKPKHHIIVEWRYDDVNNPTAQWIKFKNVKGMEETDEYSPYWENHKLQKWLTRHTKEKRHG